MKIARRHFLHLAATTAALPAVLDVARAQTYPTRTVRIIVGFGPGGFGDVTARLIGRWLSDRLGQPFIVENRPGAGGTLAAEILTKASPDGHVLGMMSASEAINAMLYNIRFSYRDIVPVATIARTPGVMVVNPAVPAKTVPEFIAYAKVNPGKINMAVVGVGSANHRWGELFKAMAGVNIMAVYYSNPTPALTDVIGGQTQVIFDGLASSIEHIRTGSLRALAVTTATRLEVLPDIPTLADSLPGYEASTVLGIGAPRNTPTEIIDRLNREINAGLADPNIKARLASLSEIVVPGSPADYERIIVEETAKWGKVIRDAHIKAE